jgi:hypothetical protein
MSDAVDACAAEYPQKWRDQQAFAAKANAFMAEQTGKKPWDANTFTVLMFPAFDTAFRFFADAATDHRCMTVLLAAEQYRREQGDYPRQLTDLVPKYLADLPADPINGESLRMRYESDRFVVYGVGSNEQDDGGDIDEVPGRRSMDTGVAVPPYPTVTVNRPAEVPTIPESP